MNQSVRTAAGGFAFLPILLVFAALLALSGPAMANSGVQCAATGMESVSTQRDHYQAGEVAAISGGGYAAGCDVQVDVQRPDGVVESFSATTDLGGTFALDYQVPPPPGVPGQYRVVVRGVDGVELASVTFEDAPAPQFDIAPSHVPAIGPRVFTAVVRNTANSSSDTARCIRVTTPAGVTITAATFVVANPGTGAGQTGNWHLTPIPVGGSNFVELRTDTNTRRGIFGSALTDANWVRFEITANAASAGTATWRARMVTSNAACASGGSTDELGVSVAQILPRQYTADFRDAGNAAMPAPTVVEDTSQAYRVRITRTAGTDDLQHIAISLPTCFTNITGVSTSDSGPPAYTAELTDNMFRLVPATKLAANGQWVQVHFTATADCPTGAHEFRTAAWKNTSPETAQGDIFQLSPGTGHPTLTVLSANVAPTVAATNATVTVNEGQTAANSGVWGDANLTDTVTLSASVGTVTQSGTNAAGTWSWSYPTTDGPAQTQVVTITANDGTASTSTTFQLNVDNVAPSATFNAPASVNEGSSIDISLSAPSDPSAVDTTAGFEYRFSCDGGDNWTAWSSSTGHSCGTTEDGTKNVKGEIRDKDGAASTYSASVTVENVAPSATFNAPDSVDEGSDISLSLTNVVDPGSADTHEYRFSCDGATWTDWSSSPTHACATDDDGSVEVRGQLRDDDGGESAVYSASVTVENVAPSATFNAPDSVDEGSAINLSLSDPSDPSAPDTAAGFQYRFSCDGGSTWTPWSSSSTHVCPTDDNGTRSVAGQIRDKDGGASTYSDSVAVNNVAPSATFNAPDSVNEGSNIELSLTGPSDPSSADTAAGFEYAFDCGDGSGYGAYSASNSRSCPTSDNGDRSVAGRIRDKDGGVTEYTATVAVGNVPPTLTSLTPSSYLVLKGTAVSVTGTYTDPGTADTFTCVVNWDEPTGTPESFAGGSSSCSADHTYTAQGTYTVSMKVRDDDGGESNTLTIIISVYDPSAGGFVTGGGWIMSPQGSYAADPAASGRANFGFNSQYKKGSTVPTGQTEFQLHFASFNFHSAAYEVLVVSGHKAQYRGTGTVNGVSGYKFVLTAYDGQITGGGGVDRFRIKITRVSDGVVVYDTRMGTSEDMDDADPLALGGGSIVIHKAK